jgi:hypothetical protein
MKQQPTILQTILAAPFVLLGWISLALTVACLVPFLACGWAVDMLERQKE